MTIATRSNFQAHPFHLVSPSLWPIMTSLTLLTTALSAGLSMHNFNMIATTVLFPSLISVILTASFWFRDIISEGTMLGDHTLAVQRGLNLGVGLFIVSEALFFLGIFWAFFHSALSPVIEMGASWPPAGIDSINPFELPLLNTALLLVSGFTITYAHHCIIGGNRKGTLDGIVLTVIIAICFTALQGLEYVQSSFTLSDSTYASCFYFSTAFHGIHVIIGTAFIAVGLWRVLSYQLTESHHLGLESSILYWHFVDIVWLFLFISIYYWGS